MWTTTPFGPGRPGGAATLLRRRARRVDRPGLDHLVPQMTLDEVGDQLLRRTVIGRYRLAVHPRDDAVRQEVSFRLPAESGGRPDDRVGTVSRRQPAEPALLRVDHRLDSVERLVSGGLVLQVEDAGGDQELAVLGLQRRADHL